VKSAEFCLDSRRQSPLSRPCFERKQNILNLKHTREASMTGLYILRILGTVRFTRLWTRGSLGPSPLNSGPGKIVASSITQPSVLVNLVDWCIVSLVIEAENDRWDGRPQVAMQL